MSTEPNLPGGPPAPDPLVAKPAVPPPAVPAAELSPDPSQLTPEEQMALFEKELKETDWGHQPC